MQQETRRLFAAVAGGGLGVLLLVVVLRSHPEPVCATNLKDGSAHSMALVSPRTITPIVPGRAYQDDFSDPTSGWPREWERRDADVSIRGGYGVDSELDEVYYAVLHDAWDRAFISGPYQADGDFDLEVRARYSYVQRSYPGNRYGVLLTQEQVDPEDPHTLHGYAFMVEINPNPSGGFDTPWWRFKEWYRTNWTGDDGGDEDRTLADDPSTAIRSAIGEWNRLRIQRRGAEFRLYINGIFVRAVSDADNTGPFYVGLIGRHTGSGMIDLSYDVLYEWDDVTVGDIDMLPAVGFDGGTYFVEEGAGVARIPIVLDLAPIVSVQVNSRTQDGTARAPDDYLAQSVTHGFAPGSVTQTLTVQIVDDALAEPDETITLTLSDPHNALLGAETAVLTILDDDEPPMVGFGNVLYSVDEGAGEAVLQVMLDNPSGQLVQVQCVTGDGTARAPGDYESVDEMLSFPAGHTTLTLTVPIVDDWLDEPSETIWLTLTNPTHALVDSARNPAMLTITDNDVTVYLPAVLSQ